MIIAVPTGIKIFSWLSGPLSKVSFATNGRGKSTITSKINKSIVIWGSSQGPTIGYPRFKAYERKSMGIRKDLIPPLIGLLLSDAWLGRQHNGHARFCFKQSKVNEEFFLMCFIKFSHFCSAPFYATKTKLKKGGNNSYPGWAFATRALPCFTYYHEIFYRTKIKIIPEELYNWLNWECLSFWIMGDGAYTGGGITLNTQSFTLIDQIRLINMLNLKLNLDCSLHKTRHQWVIYIKKKSITKNLHLLLPYFPDSMKYKLLGVKVKT